MGVFRRSRQEARCIDPGHGGPFFGKSLQRRVWAFQPPGSLLDSCKRYEQRAFERPTVWLHNSFQERVRRYDFLTLRLYFRFFAVTHRRTGTAPIRAAGVSSR